MCLQVASDDTKLKMLFLEKTKIKLNAKVENALFSKFCYFIWISFSNKVTENPE